MRIIFVRKGNKYGPEYVQNLTNMILAHRGVAGPFDSILTLTDMEDTPGATLPLRYNLPGYWSKMELFSPEMKHLRPFMYIDLDSFVFDNINKLIPLDRDRFYMAGGFRNDKVKESSVMWVPNTPEMLDVWYDFMEKPDLIMTKHKKGGDQDYLAPYCKDIWSTPESGIVSYKAHGRQEPTGTIMQFHGRPKPHECDGWVSKIWQKNN